MRKIKIVLYWVTLIPPIIDIITGAINGVKKGITDLKNGETNALQEQRKKWLQANKGGAE